MDIITGELARLDDRHDVGGGDVSRVDNSKVLGTRVGSASVKRDAMLLQLEIVTVVYAGGAATLSPTDSSG